MKALLALSVLCACSSSFAQPVDMGQFDLQSVLHCGFGTDDSRAQVEQIRQQLKPIDKADYAWTYAAKGQMRSTNALPLPVTQLALGVCSKGGEVGCGQATYFSIRINAKPEQVRRLISRAYGVDVKKTKRHPESHLPVHAMLLVDDKTQQSILYCDSGSL